MAKAQVSGTAPADVRAEVAQGAMNSCMDKKGFYQILPAVGRHRYARDFESAKRNLACSLDFVDHIRQ